MDKIRNLNFYINSLRESSEIFKITDKNRAFYVFWDSKTFNRLDEDLEFVVECKICYDTCTNISQILCFNCNYSVCETCFLYNFQDTKDANCMNCKELLNLLYIKNKHPIVYEEIQKVLGPIFLKKMKEDILREEKMYGLHLEEIQIFFLRLFSLWLYPFKFPTDLKINYSPIHKMSVFKNRRTINNLKNTQTYKLVKQHTTPKSFRKYFLDKFGFSEVQKETAYWAVIEKIISILVEKDVITVQHWIAMIDYDMLIHKFDLPFNLSLKQIIVFYFNWVFSELNNIVAYDLVRPLVEFNITGLKESLDKVNFQKYGELNNKEPGGELTIGDEIKLITTSKYQSFLFNCKLCKGKIQKGSNLCSLCHSEYCLDCGLFLNKSDNIKSLKKKIQIHDPIFQEFMTKYQTGPQGGLKWFKYGVNLKNHLKLEKSLFSKNLINIVFENDQAKINKFLKLPRDEMPNIKDIQDIFSNFISFNDSIDSQSITSINNSVSTHICDKIDKENFQLIQRITRHCPNCYTSILRSSGCDHMWCTLCRTGFHWVTGEIIKNVTNPHHMDFKKMVRTNGEETEDWGTVYHNSTVSVNLVGRKFPKAGRVLYNFTAIISRMGKIEKNLNGEELVDFANKIHQLSSEDEIITDLFNIYVNKGYKPYYDIIRRVAEIFGYIFNIQTITNSDAKNIQTYINVTRYFANHALRLIPNNTIQFSNSFSLIQDYNIPPIHSALLNSGEEEVNSILERVKIGAIHLNNLHLVFGTNSIPSELDFISPRNKTGPNNNDHIFIELEENFDRLYKFKKELMETILINNPPLSFFNLHDLFIQTFTFLYNISSLNIKDDEYYYLYRTSKIAPKLFHLESNASNIWDHANNDILFNIIKITKVENKVFPLMQFYNKTIQEKIRFLMLEKFFVYFLSSIEDKMNFGVKFHSIEQYNWRKILKVK